MKLLLTTIAVALPVLGLLHYIYSHDKIKPGPVRIMFLTILAGIVGGVVSFLIGRYIGIVDIYTTHLENVVNYFTLALFLAENIIHLSFYTEYWLVLGVPILCHALCNTIVLLYDRVDGNSLLLCNPLMFGLIGCTLAILFYVHRVIDKQLERDLKQK